LLNALQQGLDRVVGPGGGFADGNGKRATFAPPFDAVAGNLAADAFAGGGRRFLAPAIEDDEELIVAPASNEVGGSERCLEGARADA
jgi:hypothetical protein